jgi:hypothetical protein
MIPGYNGEMKTFTDIASGNKPGWSHINKFGYNPDIGQLTYPEDVWGAGGIMTWSTTAAIDTISSSDAGDGHDIYIQGLDANWLEVTQTATLDGQNKVVLGTPLIRVYRAVNLGSTNIAGTFYLYEDTAIVDGVPTDTTKIRAVIDDGDNQTEMCIYTVPADKCGFFMGGYVGIDKVGSRGASFTWRARAFGGVFAVKGRITCNSDGSGHWVYEYPMYEYIPPKTDILIRCEEVTANATAVVGGFTILLQDLNTP